MTDPRLFAGAAIGLVLAAAAGFGIARLTAPPPPAPAAAAPEANAPAGTLTMTAEVIRAAGVKVEAVSAGGLGAEVLASATVAAAPDGQAVLTAHAAGAVTRIFKRLGDPVRAGETIALVESREAAAIAADRSVASAKAALARQTLAREQRLFDQKVSPRQDVERAQAEASAANAEVRRAQAAAGVARVAADGRSIVVSSPISGRITAMTTALGSYVQSETELFRVADPARIQVEAAVVGTDAGRIQPGDSAVLDLPTGATIPATVRSIAPSLDPQTRAATVVLTVATPQALSPGQLVRARIRPTGAVASTGVSAPDEAVQSVGGRDVVFVRTPQGFRTQAVTLGARGGGQAEIVSGLAPGQPIATRNAFLLKAELGKGGDEE